jgi:hypothetical protein
MKDIIPKEAAGLIGFFAGIAIVFLVITVREKLTKGWE